VHGFSLVKGKARHAMEDYLVAELKKVKTLKWESLQHMMVIWDTTSSTTTLVQQE
jgi:hypothetical protein